MKNETAISARQLAQFLVAFDVLNIGAKNAILKRLGFSAVLPPTPMECKEFDELIKQFQQTSFEK